MKTRNSLESLLPERFFELAQDLSLRERASFSELVAFLGLDPKCDLRHADLAYIDLSNSDIRGYDFTGSILRGAVGVNVRFDSTTRLAEADVTDSLFGYEVQKAKFFKAHPQLVDQVGILSNDYWANTIIRIANLLEAGSDREAGLHIARAVFDEAKNSSVRFDILLRILSVTDPRDHKNFLFSLLARGLDDSRLLRPVLGVLKSNFMGDLDAFNVMLKFLSHEDKSIQHLAISAVFLSKHFFQALPEIRERALSSNNPMVRRALVGRLARKELKNCHRLLDDDRATNYLDFAEPISLERLEVLAARSYTRVDYRDVEELQKRFEKPIPRSALIQTAILMIGEKYGIPFDVYTGYISTDEEKKRRLAANSHLHRLHA